MLKSLVEDLLRVNDFYLKPEADYETIFNGQRNPKARSQHNRVLIDVQPLKQGTYFRGIGRYTLSLTKNLCNRNPQVEFILYCTNIGKKGNLEMLIEEINSWQLQNVQIFVIDVFQQNKFIAQSVAKKILEKQIIQMDPTHILTASNFEHPLDVIYLGRDCFDNIAILIHDVIPLHYVEDLLPSKAQQRIYNERLIAAMTARTIFTNSHFTKNDFKRQTGRRKNVIDIGGAGFFQIKNVNMLPRKDRKGILCVGADTPHKNVEGLIRGYLLLPEILRINHPLYIVGVKNKSLFRDVLAQNRLAGLAIEFLEYIDDAKLENLYSSVVLTVVPSFIEGLSMPIFESWSYGTPVLVSEKSVMHEIVGNDESTFDPKSALSISTSITRLLGEDSKWVEQQDWLLNRRLLYTWDLVASKMDHWIREAID
jgi:glycosyltransferase involved in cell wall biosynthesis